MWHRTASTHHVPWIKDIYIRLQAIEAYVVVQILRVLENILATRMDGLLDTFLLLHCIYSA